MITITVALHTEGEENRSRVVSRDYQFTTYRDAEEAARILSWISDEQGADPDPLITSEIK